MVGSVVSTFAKAFPAPAFHITTAGVEVALRNLVIAPFPGGGAADGIFVGGGAAIVTVENCLIANLPGNGIIVTGPSILRVADTTIRDNGQGIALLDGARAVVTRATISGHTGNWAVLAHATAAASLTSAEIADSTMDGNLGGILAWSSNASGAVAVTVKDSRLVDNASRGVYARSDAGANVKLSASNNIVANNGTTGIEANASGASVLASGNTVTGNTTGLLASGGLLESAGNNTVRGNGTDSIGVTGVGTI